MTKIYKKRVSVGNWLKRGIDFKEGELLEIANEGIEQEGEFGTQNIFLCKTSDGKEGNVSFNQTSLNGIIDAYTENATKWIGKKVKSWKILQNVSGEFKDVWYFSHPDAKLTKSGFVLSLEDKMPEEGEMPEEDEIPVIEPE